MAISGSGLGTAEAILQLLFNADNLTEEKIAGIATKIKALALNMQHESDRVRYFKVDIRWKQRVIHVPRAITATKKLLRDMTTGLKEKAEGLAAPFEEFAHNLKLESFTEDPLGTGRRSITAAFDQISHFISELNLLVGAVDNALDTAGDLTDLFDQVINEIEHLDTFFLPQNSLRNKTTVTYFKRTHS